MLDCSWEKGNPNTEVCGLGSRRRSLKHEFRCRALTLRADLSDGTLLEPYGEKLVKQL